MCVSTCQDFNAPTVYVHISTTIAPQGSMEVIIGGAVVGLGAWLARKLAKLRHRRRNARFLAQQAMVEDEVEARGDVFGAGGRSMAGQPAMLMAGYGTGTYDNAAYYAAAAQLSDDIVYSRHAHAISAPAQLGMPTGPYTMNDREGTGTVLIEEVESRQWGQDQYHTPVPGQRRLLTAL